MSERRILLFCKPGLYAHGLRLVLEADSRIQLVQAEEGQPLARLLGQVLPDVLLVQQDRLALMIGDRPETIPLDRAVLLVLLGENENAVHLVRIQELALTDPAQLAEVLATY